MLIFDFHVIGNNLCLLRKKSGMTQAEVAEKAGISDRTYADIERGSVNMRIETFLRICKVLKTTPNEILTTEKAIETEDVMELLNSASGKDREVALRLIEVYLTSNR